MGCGVTLKNNMTDLDNYRLSRKDKKKIAKAIARKQVKTIRSTAKGAVTDSLLFQLFTAHDKFGFGKKRLEKLLIETAELSNHVEACRVTENELIAQLKEETGFDLNEMMLKHKTLIEG